MYFTDFRKLLGKKIVLFQIDGLDTNSGDVRLIY
jgi:hypothetical protein